MAYTSTFKIKTTQPLNAEQLHGCIEDMEGRDFVEKVEKFNFNLMNMVEKRNFFHEELGDMYGEYLIEFHSDTIHTKDQHIEAMNDGAYWEDFVEWMWE